MADEVRVKLLDVAAAAKYLGLTPGQLRNARALGRFCMPRKIGARLYWTYADLDAWLESLVPGMRDAA